MERCRKCGGLCNKNGRLGKSQRYRCKKCGASHLSVYIKNAYKFGTNRWIIDLNRESCGISSISRLLKISKTTVIKRMKQLSRKVHKLLIFKGKSYEVDELRTYIGNKKNECWVCLAVENRREI